MNEIKQMGVNGSNQIEMTERYESFGRNDPIIKEARGIFTLVDNLM